MVDVKYEDRLGADFDHKEVTLIFGKGNRVGKMCVYDSTLKDDLSDAIGRLGFYETYSNHLITRSIELDNHIHQLNILIKNRELLNLEIAQFGSSVDRLESFQTNK